MKNRCIAEWYLSTLLFLNNKRFSPSAEQFVINLKLPEKWIYNFKSHPKILVTKPAIEDNVFGINLKNLQENRKSEKDHFWSIRPRLIKNKLQQEKNIRKRSKVMEQYVH